MIYFFAFDKSDSKYLIQKYGVPLHNFFELEVHDYFQISFWNSDLFISAIAVIILIWLTHLALLDTLNVNSSAKMLLKKTNCSGFCQNYYHPWWGIIFRNVRRVHRFILCQNHIMFPVVFVAPSFEPVYCFLYGHRRVAVARYRMICLVLTLFECKLDL